MRILIVADAYPPEVRSAAQLMKELAVALREKGHDVLVVTSSAPYGDTVENGIRVLRIKMPSHHNVNFIAKGLSWLMMPFLFYRAVRKKIKRPIDATIVHSPPLTLAIATYLVKRHYGAKYVLNVQDFFPQNAVDLGVLRNPLLIRFFEIMERWAYRTSDAIVTPSYEHRNFMIEKRGVPEDKVTVVRHWIDVKPFKEIKGTGAYRSELRLESKMIFHFGGVIGPSQGVDLLIRLAERCAPMHDIHFVIAGEGTEKAKLERMVKEKKLTNVSFRPYIEKEKYIAFLKDMDVGVLTLTSKNTTPAVPAKIMFYLASGLPVLGFLHAKSEAHRIVQEARCGYTAAYENEDACYETLMQMYRERSQLKELGENGLRYVEKYLTPEVCVSQWEAVL